MGRYGGRRSRRGGREDDRRRDVGSRVRGRPGGRSSRFGGGRGDYGPILARELDSSYEEKVNRNYANSIFVGNLTYHCTPDDLRDFFSQIGDVVRADIITSRGHHRGMGTVEFTDAKYVDEAIRQYDGSMFMDRQIFVRQDNPPPATAPSTFSPSSSASSYERRNGPRKQITGPPPLRQQGYEILVGNIPFSLNWQALKDMFRDCGEVTRADVELDRDGYSRGFGTVIFADEESMNRAIDKYNGYEIEGHVLDVREGYQNPSRNHSRQQQRQPQRSQQQDSTFASGSSPKGSKFTEGFVGGGERNNFIFCSNLPFSTDRSDLFDLFETIGKVNNAELRYDSTGAPTGIAVIEYANVEDADVCIDRLNNYNYGGCDLNISYARSD